MVHDSTDMPEVLKMQYLLSALKGDVARQFEHVQITSDNYSVTWEALLKRFDNTKVLKREYFKAFFSLEKMSNDSTEELARVVNEACRLVRGLERLNEPVHTWDTPLSNLLFYKLDKKTLMAWEQHSVDDKTDDYKCLISFLEQRVNILKSSAQNVTNNIQTNSVSVTGKHGKRDGRYVALPVQQANIMKHGVAKCPMCSEQHHIQVCELRRAEITAIRLVQREVYAKELECLKRGQLVMRTSSLKFINPIVGEDEVLRVGGRLSNADIPDERRHPVIIPGRHRLAELIADKYHKILHHASLQLMLSTIQQRYWIMGARNAVKRTVHSCVRCTRCRPSLVRQPMADLPQQRVRQARPFSISGVDYAGPIYTKGSHRRAVPTKCYIAIFICFVTKAVHIELVSNLSSYAFLAALRRFVARRGKVAELHSDNGTNFRGANNNLRDLYKLLNSKEHQEAIIGWCSEQEIRWKFTPPAAPHFGGLWEAAVKSMKFHLKRVLGTGQLTYEDLTTLLTEIEACLNSRPITAITEDPYDMEALTPGHFLVGNSLQTVPAIDISEIPTNRLNHWRIVQRHMQHIWQRWHREYLQTLQKRAKWNNNPCTIVPGRLVVLQEDNVAVCKWPLGRITEIHPGKDGVTRVVTVKCSNGKEIRRPVHRIAPLPIEEN
ncbi:uncharacterized protein LOC125760709 [Anopheles funestus]|nr:uncharacterized protein LOC125760709 [Anopheles funestus]